MALEIKRAYDPPAAGDGYRVLVDRLWPRGVSKNGLAVEAWLKEVAPSDGLRRWFGHDPTKWEEFRRRYWAELGAPPQQERLRALSRLAAGGTLTLVYAARDTQRNNAAVLREALEELLQRREPA